MTMQLLEASPLWPATLDHIRYDSPDAARLQISTVGRDGHGGRCQPTEMEFFSKRRHVTIVIGPAQAAGHAYSAFALRDGNHLGRPLSAPSSMGRAWHCCRRRHRC